MKCGWRGTSFASGLWEITTFSCRRSTSGVVNRTSFWQCQQAGLRAVDDLSCVCLVSVLYLYCICLGGSKHWKIQKDWTVAEDSTAPLGVNRHRAGRERRPNVHPTLVSQLVGWSTLLIKGRLKRAAEKSNNSLANALTEKNLTKASYTLFSFHASQI